jgi:hypothetical protein
MKVINRCSISIVMGCAFALLSVNVGFGMHKAAPKKGDQAHPKYAAPKKHPAAAPKKAPASVAPKIPATAVPLAADQENNLAHNNGHVNKTCSATATTTKAAATATATTAAAATTASATATTRSRTINACQINASCC